MNYNPNIHHRKSIRLKGYDYSQAGLYFITICCDNRKCLFGEITDGKMLLNECGIVAFNEWMKTPELRKNIELGEFIIMPNHIHGIINITRRGVLHTPQNDTPQNDTSKNDTPQNDTPKNDTPKNDAQNQMGEFNSPLPHSPSQTIGAIVRGYKSSVTKQINILRGIDSGKTVWQRNYHEHIIRDEKSYQTISNYIINNPKNWKDDKFYRE